MNQGRNVKLKKRVSREAKPQKSAKRTQIYGFQRALLSTLCFYAPVWNSTAFIIFQRDNICALKWSDFEDPEDIGCDPCGASTQTYNQVRTCASIDETVNITQALIDADCADSDSEILGAGCALNFCDSSTDNSNGLSGLTQAISFSKDTICPVSESQNFEESACSAQCGPGLKKKVAFNTICDLAGEPVITYEDCDGEFGNIEFEEWSDWNGCSADSGCGMLEGSRSRTRRTTAGLFCFVGGRGNECRFRTFS